MEALRTDAVRVSSLIFQLNL